MKNSMKTILKSLMCMVLSVPMFTSCYDDSAIWDKFEELEGEIQALADELNSQVDALNSLVNGLTTVSSCEKNQDGSYTVTLSNGTKFNVYPKAKEYSSLVTYTVIDGVKYWATYDAAGELVVLTDASGNPIPVVAKKTDVSVVLKDGIYYIVIDGKEYATGYDVEDMVQVFSSCTPLTDASGNVYAIRFTFGEGMEVTVTLDGYTGVIFKQSELNSTVVNEYYIDYGAKQSFLLDKVGVVDYVMQVPDGWRVSETTEKLTGNTYIEITAPAKETIELGAAVAEGDLKVVSVVEGGKASISKLYLTTDPFKVYEVNAMTAVIEPTFGIQKFAYGVILIEDFDEASLTAEVNKLLSSSSSLPKGYHISETGINKTIADIIGEEVSEDNSYVFWAVPALYAEGDDAGYYVKEEMLRHLIISPITAKIEVSNVYLLDADITVKVGGTFSMYAGVLPVTDTYLDEIVYLINNDAVDPIETSLSYTGPASEFPVKEDPMYIEHATKYAVWVVPVDKDKTEYKTNDVIYEEFTTKDVVAGGNATLTSTDFTATSSSLTSTISCADAAMIYYAYLSDADGKRYSTAENETKMSKILASDNCKLVRGATADASINELRPKTTMWLYAVAVGKDGLYGDVLCKSATTDNVSYNNLSLSIAEPEVTSDMASFVVSVSGGTATEYIYWCGYEGDPFWLSANYCGGKIESAQEYMAANPDAEQIVSVMKKNGAISSDGKITINDLDMNTNHVFIVMAKDATGNYSQAAYKRFTTLVADFGDMVLSDNPEWETTKTWITDNIRWLPDTFEKNKSNMSYASYSFGIKIPTDMTAYISCFAPQATDMLESVLEIEEYCSRRVSVGSVVVDENGEYPRHPDWYDDNGKLIQGSLANIYTMYPHGSPTLAAFTLFPSSGHSRCSAWENGECSNYKYFMDELNKYLSIEYWKEYLIDFGNYAYNGDPTHPYSRSLTDPEKINQIAQQYYDLYYKYYKDAEPIVYVNEGRYIEVKNREAAGLDDQGNVIDKVVIILVDAEGNYYEPMYIQVPNYFK